MLKRQVQIQFLKFKVNRKEGEFVLIMFSFMCARLKASQLTRNSFQNVFSSMTQLSGLRSTKIDKAPSQTLLSRKELKCSRRIRISLVDEATCYLNCLPTCLSECVRACERTRVRVFACVCACVLQLTFTLLIYARHRLY